MQRAARRWRSFDSMSYQIQKLTPYMLTVKQELHITVTA